MMLLESDYTADISYVATTKWKSLCGTMYFIIPAMMLDENRINKMFQDCKLFGSSLELYNLFLLGYWVINVPLKFNVNLIRIFR